MKVFQKKKKKVPVAPNRLELGRAAQVAFPTTFISEISYFFDIFIYNFSFSSSGVVYKLRS